jgi:hypothetical protein
MPLLDKAYLEKLREYLDTGDLELDFNSAGEEKRLEMLDFLELLMEVAELADQVATRLIFKDSSLGLLAGAKTQK